MSSGKYKNRHFTRNPVYHGIIKPLVTVGTAMTENEKLVDLSMPSGQLIL